MSYTEDTLVQQTTADYLQQRLGWKSVYAYNKEEFGPDSLLGRTSDREVVLTRTLREKLMTLNPNLPNAAYDEAVRQIIAIAASQTLAATNREKYTQLRDGVQVTFRNNQGERLRQRLRVFDFQLCLHPTTARSLRHDNRVRQPTSKRPSHRLHRHAHERYCRPHLSSVAYTIKEEHP